MLSNITQYNREKHIKSLLFSQYPMSSEVSRARSCATFDLYFGPLGNTDDDGEPYSFTDAIKLLTSYARSLPSKIWIDLDCDHISECEPEGYTDEESGEYIDPYCDNTYYLDRRDILNYLFDRELASYL